MIKFLGATLGGLLVFAMVPTVAISAPPPASELVYDLRNLSQTLLGNWYPVDDASRPKPRSAFTHGFAACTAAITAERGSDFSVRRSKTGLEMSIGAGFMPVKPSRHGTPGAEGFKLDSYIIYLLTPAPDGSPRIWVRNGENGFDTIYHKCP